MESRSPKGLLLGKPPLASRAHGGDTSFCEVEASFVRVIRWCKGGRIEVMVATLCHEELWMDSHPGQERNLCNSACGSDSATSGFCGFAFVGCAS